VENATKRSGQWWDHFTTELYIRPLADQGIEPWATRAKAHPDERVRTFEPGAVQVVVVGGGMNNAFAVASGRYWTTASVDEWAMTSRRASVGLLAEQLELELTRSG